jgi:protocatechuate 3,4-dioxygenase beta subunit
MDDDQHDHDRGLSADLWTLLDRRRALKLIAGVGLVTFAAACGSDEKATSSSTTAGSGSSTTTAGSGSSTTTSGSGACSPIPEETPGPYPGDGSNGPNVLTESGIVRSDIRSSFGSSTTVAEGAPLTIKLTVLDRDNRCQPRSGAAVYLWHCDRDGNYSMYSQGITNENYLRGVQETDRDGTVTFTSIFPGAYSGRWPHAHFEVYPSLDEATRAGTILTTSQLALPEDVCDVVYASDGYSRSVSNFSRMSLQSDNVFNDGVDQQLATVTGSVDGGFVAELTFAA